MVGFYDSGIGGLTILKEVLKLQPNFSYIYFADTQALPLGDKSVEFIRNRVTEACIELFNCGCNVVVLACNTASVTSIRYIQQVWLKENYPNKQVLSIAIPLIELANNKLLELKLSSGLIFSTLATHNSGFYQYKLITDGFLNCKSVSLSGLANAIEDGDNASISHIINTQVVDQKINPHSIKYIILACTHYKWAISEIKAIFPVAEIIEPSQILAVKLFDYLKRHPEFPHSNTQLPQIIVTGNNKNFKKFLKELKINQVLLEKYYSV